ncbi:MAG TPA: tail fiber domain-containing protein [Vicinamibacterales bacterium]|nr:tail fiber domain-containing protein [Vicinamibacterales bacterium]
MRPAPLGLVRVFTAVIVVVSAASNRADAQSLGTFTWQLQPYCNVVTVTIVQQGAVYTMDGYDDRCGVGARAPLVGLATLNPDGTIAIGWHLVVSGSGQQIGARISPNTLGGTWSDSAENAGTLAFGVNTGGAERPPPVATIPPSFALQPDGGFVARGDILTGAIPESGAGVRMMWHPAKAAFRAGEVEGAADATVWDDATVGRDSAAFGYNTQASGNQSFAAGFRSTATGQASVAIGAIARATGPYSAAFNSSTASGPYSAAFGGFTLASGQFSAAIGDSTVASGQASAAMGQSSVASGQASLAGGQNARASGTSSLAFGNAEVLTTAYGSFAWGDLSTSTRVQADQPGQFIVRAAGGVRFATHPSQSTGVVMFANASAWSSLSDVNSKEHFRDLADEEVLTKIATMPVREWSYKAQGASIRHMGPTAQDFRAAFGLGEDPLRISTIDADGVALAAIKALEARTRALNEALMRENDGLRARLTRLEQLLERR